MFISSEPSVNNQETLRKYSKKEVKYGVGVYACNLTDCASSGSSGKIVSEGAVYIKEHSIIRFDSLYEEREYELIAVFYSQVFYENDNVFKYYKFFQAQQRSSGRVHYFVLLFLSCRGALKSMK